MTSSFSYEELVEKIITAPLRDQERTLKLLTVMNDLRTKDDIETVEMEYDNPDHALAVLLSGAKNKERAHINWCMTDVSSHKDLAWLTNTLLLGDSTEGRKSILEAKNEVHAEFLSRAFRAGKLTPFSQLPTMLLEGSASLLALSVATISPFANQIWDYAQHSPEKIDYRELLAAFAGRNQLARLSFYPQNPANIKAIVETAALRLADQPNFTKEDARLAAGALVWSVDKVDKESVKTGDRFVEIDQELFSATQKIVAKGHIDVFFGSRQTFGGVVLLATAFEVLCPTKKEKTLDLWLDAEENLGPQGNVMNFPLSSTAVSFSKPQTYRFMNLFSQKVVFYMKQEAGGPTLPTASGKYVKSLLNNMKEVTVLDQKDDVTAWLEEIMDDIKKISYSQHRSNANYGSSNLKMSITQMLDRCMLRLATRWVSEATPRPQRKI